MFNVLKTLFDGANARAEERLTDAFAIDLIEQKIREAQMGLDAAKATLASLIVRQRNEQKTFDRLEVQIADLESRVRAALAAGQDALATEGAGAIAVLENERAVRRQTLDNLAERVIRTQSSVEKVNRRIIDLRQGMISARAADAERRTQKTISRSLGSKTAVREAEELIARVMGQSDPLEEGEVLDEIDAGLSHTGVRDRLGAAGFGGKAKVDAADVLARLKAASPAATKL